MTTPFDPRAAAADMRSAARQLRRVAAATRVHGDQSGDPVERRDAHGAAAELDRAAIAIRGHADALEAASGGPWLTDQEASTLRKLNAPRGGPLHSTSFSGDQLAGIYSLGDEDAQRQRWHMPLTWSDVKISGTVCGITQHGRAVLAAWEARHAKA